MSFIAMLPLLNIHVTAVVITLTLVVVSDLHGLAWVFGMMQTLPARRMHFFHIAIWIGLLTVITAGFFMFIGYSDYLFSLLAFKIKMVCVAFLVLNAFFIGKHLTIATESPFKTLAAKEKFILLVSGAISTTGWIGALICAQFL